MNNSNTEPGVDSNVSQDELIIQQSREIEKEISDSIPLIGEKEDLITLKNEYINDEVYQKKVVDLSKKYNSIRRTRPDGNCFFRGFGFAYLEYLIDKKEEFLRFRDLAEKSKDKLLELQFPKFTVEDFHDIFIDVINTIDSESENRINDLYKTFNEQGFSDYFVVYLRLIVSAHLQENSEFYQNFIEGNRTVIDFCRQEVEPMYKESDHIHIIALSSALNVGVRVRYMDRGDGGEVIAHDFPEGSPPRIHLLYRPGHYDILYEKEDSS